MGKRSSSGPLPRTHPSQESRGRGLSSQVCPEPRLSSKSPDKKIPRQARSPPPITCSAASGRQRSIDLDATLQAKWSHTRRRPPSRHLSASVACTSVLVAGLSPAPLYIYTNKKNIYKAVPSMISPSRLVRLSGQLKPRPHLHTTSSRVCPSSSSLFFSSSFLCRDSAVRAPRSISTKAVGFAPPTPGAALDQLVWAAAGVAASCVGTYYYKMVRPRPRPIPGLARRPFLYSLTLISGTWQRRLAHRD